MRWVILSDIHANRPAFQAVMSHLRTVASQSKDKTASQFIFTGDLVGYGPHPNECIQDLYNLVMLNDENWKRYAIAGNSDLAALQDNWRKIAAHAQAQETLQWTAEQLTDKNRQRLEALPKLALEFPPHYTFVHATIHDPTGVVTSDYMDLAGGLNFDDAAQELKTNLAIYGHTHRPRITCVDLNEGSEILGFSQKSIPVQYSSENHDQNSEFVYRYSDDLRKGCKIFICVGSIGQPRDDGDPRAAYGILDDEAQTATLYRVPYNIQETVADLKKLPLPIRPETITNLVTKLTTGS